MNETPKAQGSDYLSELIKSVMSAPPPQEREINTESQGGEKSARQSPPPELFSSLLSNPELLSKLPTILSTVGPIIESLSKGGGQAIKTSAPETIPEKKAEPSNDRRAALLCAMKPYLSHDRQLAIDYIIKLGRLGDILKTL